MENNMANLTIETSAEDKAILDMLSSKDMTINKTALEELCSSWNSKVSALDLNRNTVAQSFKPLFDSELLSSYINDLSDAVDSLNNNLQTITNILISNSEAHLEAEVGRKEESNNIVNETRKRKESSPYNSNYLIKELSNQDSLGISTIINKESKKRNKTVEELLNSESIVKEVKDTITSSHLVSNKIKEQVKKMDDKNLIDNIKNMKDNKMITNTSGESFLNSYYENIAKQNNTTKEDLFEEVNNKELVYNQLYYVNEANKYIDKEADNVNFNKNMIDTYYDANNLLDDNTSNAFKVVIDTLADNKKISSDSFLKTCSANDFSEARKSLSISANYLESKTDNLQELLNNVLGGE